ncbi:MAG: glycoside hydrolase family 55 protein [Armatimonadetes bacterium]|nr:glycoside hydrolase family 55 protein [Armatimonadota bacterium]
MRNVRAPVAPCLLCIACWLLAGPSAAKVLNARDFGAKGDAVTDDTAALQAALDAACAAGGGELFIPAGEYLVSRTLRIERTALLLRGAGSSGYVYSPNTTNLVWIGEDGGTLMETRGCSGLVFSGMNWIGKDWDRQEQKGRAGILFLARSAEEAGHTLNCFRDMSFRQADVGIQMGGQTNEPTCSDCLFENITFRLLDAGFRVLNDQGVNYQFNFVFALDCKCVFDLQSGGNILVSNAQCTNCDLMANIGGGGYCVGTYHFDNCRVESSTGGKPDRRQVLRCHPRNLVALVRFTGLNDCQWASDALPDQSGLAPLFDLGPGASVVVQGSILFGRRVAQLTGVEAAPASIIFRESLVRPDSIQAGPHSYYKLVDCFEGFSTPTASVQQWAGP